MSNHTIVPELITADGFAPFGEVIQKNPANRVQINEGRIDRYPRLASIDIADADGFVNVSIVSGRVASTLPYQIELVERHPLGSQAFIPLSRQEFVVVVAPPGDSVAPADLRAFITNGDQGVNFHRGVWHMPLICLEAGQEFLVIDRGGRANCDELPLEEPVTLKMH